VLEDRGIDTVAVYQAVGLYMVVTRRNIHAVTAMGRLAADLGMDYFVPQPISLAPGHPLRAELGLSSDHVAAVTTELARLYANVSTASGDTGGHEERRRWRFYLL